MDNPSKVRLDRWLWAARFFKTRAQAKAAIERGRVHVHVPGRDPEHPQQIRPKVSKEVSIGDTLSVRRGDLAEVVRITGIAERRGSAEAAAALYEETHSSIEARETERARRRMERLGLQVPTSKPDKNHRRQLRKLKQET